MRFDFNVLPRLKAFISNYALMMALYTLSRALFFILNYDRYKSADSAGIINSFLYGVYFDNATVAMLMLPIALLFFIPLKDFTRAGTQAFFKVLFLILQFPIFALHVCDSEYFKFTGARMTVGVFAMTSDIENQFIQYVINYWHIVIACLIALTILWRFYRTASLRPESGLQHNNVVTRHFDAKHILSYSLCWFAVLVFSFLSIRGGFQSKPLQPNYAFVVADQNLGILALNSSFTILKSNTRDSLKRAQHFTTDDEARSHLLKPIFTGPHMNGAKEPQNVVVIIIESGATEFWGAANKEGYTPFLDSLAKKGLFFRNSFANGRRSIEALPAIILGVPALMEHPLAKSRYQFNEWHGLGEAVREKHYDTSFYQGSEKGSMNFDAIAKLAGIQNYFSLSEYPNKKDYDGFWGIFDEPYLQYYASELSRKPVPFLSVVFTLSSHQPYTIPEQHRGQFKKGPTPMHESIGYVDYSIEQFFKKSESEPWFKNTLFIITGDHTQMSPSITYDSDLGRHMVPILFYHPGGKLDPAKTQKVVQHADILPSVVDYLGINPEKTNSFGHSIWQDDPGRAIFYQNGILYLVRGPHAIRFDENRLQTSYLCFTDPNSARECAVGSEMPANEASSLDNEAKAYLQYFKNGMIGNSLYR